MINSFFNEELQIVESIFKGDISEQDVLEYLNAFNENKTYPRHLKTLADTSLAKFSFSYRSLKAFNQAKTASLENYTIVITAVIVNSPATAAIATLYQSIAKNKKYKYKVFSTQEAAIDWLDSFNFTEEKKACNS